MKSVFIHSIAKFNRELPFKNKRRNEAFSVMLNQAKKNGFKAYLSRYDFYDKNTKKLKKAWVFDEGWKIVKDKQVDLFYYHGKTRNINKEIMKVEKINNLPILNHLELESVCDDKLLTFNIFPDMVPKTFLVNDFFELQRVFHYIKTDKMVLKPRDGSNGRGIIVMEKKKLTNGIKKNTIVQEFIDSSNGICGIKKMHDLRVIIIDGKIDHCYLRIPKKGSYLGNAAQGAKKIFLKISDLPSTVIRRVKIIDKHFEHYGPRVYSADFIMDPNGKPWLIELNSKPGTMWYDDAPQTRKRYYNHLYQTLTKLV